MSWIIVATGSVGAVEPAPIGSSSTVSRGLSVAGDISEITLVDAGLGSLVAIVIPPKFVLNLAKLRVRCPGKSSKLDDLVCEVMLATGAWLEEAKAVDMACENASIAFVALVGTAGTWLFPRKPGGR